MEYPDYTSYPPPWLEPTYVPRPGPKSDAPPFEMLATTDEFPYKSPVTARLAPGHRPGSTPMSHAMAAAIATAEADKSGAPKSGTASVPGPELQYSRSEGRKSKSSANNALHVSSSVKNGAVTTATKRLDSSSKESLNDIRKVCKDAQARIKALGDAIGRQPGIPASLIDMVNTDLRHVAQQFIHTTFYCRKLENKLEEIDTMSSKERAQLLSDHLHEVNTVRRKYQDAAERLAKAEEQLRDCESGYGNVDKRRKVELEKKTEKINNQKRRIKEQQDQIEKLKDKYVNPGKPGFRSSRATSRIYDDSDDSLEFDSAVSNPDHHRNLEHHRSPPLPVPAYRPSLSAEQEAMLLANLQRITSSAGPSHHAELHGPPPPASYGGFPPPMGPPMNPMNGASMGPMGPGAMGPYSGYPPHMGAYGPQMGPDFGYGGHMPPPHGYGGVPNYQPRHVQQYPQALQQPHPESGRVTRESQHPSNALVLRRNDDSEFDSETKVWKDMFSHLFISVHGWAKTHCSVIIPGAAEDITCKNAILWDYILKVAVCYKDPQATPKHALYMLNTAIFRSHFIARMMIQFIQQEMITWKFWMGWDKDTDVQLKSLGPVLDNPGHSLETRRDARQQVRRIIEDITRDKDYARFKTFKQNHNAKRMRDIVGPFVNAGDSSSKEAYLGLQSIASMAMEISTKTLTSRLTFSFTFNECAVKFSHESHVALNSDMNGLALQHKHVRIGLVVAPGISYRDDSGSNIVPRCVAKAQVLIMK